MDMSLSAKFAVVFCRLALAINAEIGRLYYSTRRMLKNEQKFALFIVHDKKSNTEMCYYTVYSLSSAQYCYSLGSRELHQ